jgi:hypothetical protein
MSASVCCIAKDEKPYIQEWICWHLNIGFSHIYIYDNSDSNELDYLNSKNIKVIHFPGRPMQQQAYHDYFENYKCEHTWCAIIDCDEFIILKKHKSIIEFCKDYITYDTKAIGINWIRYGSNGHLVYSPEPVMERFKIPSPGVDIHIKCIVECNSLVSWGDSSHYPGFLNGFIRDTNGKILDSSYNKNGPVNVIQINHYYTKSREEFISKYNRGYPDGNTPDRNEYLQNFYNYV